MSHAAPGKHYRMGLSLIEVMDLFPSEEAATKWFEGIVWGGGRCCGKCGSLKTREANHKTMPYWCTDCRSYFSVRTGTPLAKSNVPLRKWAIAIYLCLTSLKSVSSMKLHRDLKVTQSTAWFMLHRIREAWAPKLGSGGEIPFTGPVEVDEKYMGGKRKNMSNAKRRELADTGRGAVGKTAVVGMRDRATNQVRAEVVDSTDKTTLQGFVVEHTSPAAMVYTDEAAVYADLPRDHESVKHSVSEYVRGQAHTNGIESFCRCSNVPTRGPSTRCPRSTSTATSRSSPARRASGNQTPSTRCPPRSSGSWDGSSPTGSSSRTTGSRPGRGRSGSTRRSKARARVSGVAPARSRFGSSIGGRIGQSSSGNMR